MKITDFRNTTAKEIADKKHNIWLGISLGNKYFNREHLTDYINWAVQNTKSKILILIADEPQAINYEVFEKMKPETAKAKVLRKGDEIEKLVKGITVDLPQSDIEIARWKDINNFDNYEQLYKILADEFEKNLSFKQIILEVVKLNMEDRIADLDEEQVEKLAGYVLMELPIFFNGTKYKEAYYDLHIYPGLSLIDDLILEIQASKQFPELAEKLNIKHPIAIAEAYAE